MLIYRDDQSYGALTCNPLRYSQAYLTRGQSPFVKSFRNRCAEQAVSALALLLAKVALVCLAVSLMWWRRAALSARSALVPLSALYALVAGSHVGFAIFQGLLAAPVGVAFVLHRIEIAGIEAAILPPIEQSCQLPRGPAFLV